MVTVAETLATAAQHHRAGRLAEAEQGYRQVLSVEPQNAYALHQLGALAGQAGQFDRAVDFFERAVRADPSQVAYHANLAACYRQLGRMAEAETALRSAIKLQPDLSQLHAALGSLLEAGARYAEAADCYRRVVQSEPRSADAHFDLGSALHRQQDTAQAVACYRQALALDPQHVWSHVNLGVICKQQGAADEAIDHLQTALRLQPNNATALANLGSACEAAGRTAEALAAYRAAVQANPDSKIARTNLGGLLRKLGQLSEARDAFQQVIAADPRFVNAHLGIAGVYYDQGDMDRAMASCQQALAVDPGCARACLNMAIMLNEQRRTDEAAVHCRRAIELDPRLPAAHANLAIALHMRGHIDEAVAHYRQEMEIDPGSALQHSNFLYCLNFHPSIDPQTVFDEHRAWARKHADALTAASPPHANDRSPDRRLRIGYVSPHFFSHSVNFFTEPILASHDHRNFEIFCYSDVVREDAVTARLRGYADCWRTIKGHGHEQVARQIRADRIDVLVDLTGHIGENRMPVFARKPAPVQATYIGYQNTTGMRAMDYRLTDAYADPPGMTERFHTERLARLPTTFFCYRPPDESPDVGSLPAEERGWITFGSFNNFMKISPEVLTTWAEILLAVPNSRLVILAGMTESLEQYLRETFAGHGVGSERLELVGHLPRAEYLKRIERTDVALDPFPFDGHTTTCDCLWLGAPVVTLVGQTYVSRYGASGLNTLGLTELIADTREKYKQIAVELAGDVQRLAQLRFTLRERMNASPLLDFATFTRNLEAEYRRMWRDWCAS